MPASTRAHGSARARVALGVMVLLALSLSRFALANELPSRFTPQRATLHAPRRELVGILPAPRLLSPELIPHHLFLHPVAALRNKPAAPSAKPYVLPVARRFITKRDLNSPHHDYPAWDLPLPIGTRVVAVRGGLVEDVTASGRCGHGVIVLATDGYLYTYCHGSKVEVHPGDEVATGQRLLLSGESGHATGPHLHLQIQSPSGRLLCPQSLVTSWFHGGHKGPRTATSKGCYYLTSGKKHRHHHHHKTRRHHHHHAQHHTHKRPTRKRRPRPQPSPTFSPSPRPSPLPTITPTPTATASPTPLPTPSET